MTEHRTIKVKFSTYRALKILAAKRGETMMDLIDRLVKKETTMDYQIKPVAVEGFGDADGVYENRDGAWLGEVSDDSVQVYSDDGGDYIPAPANWRDLIVRVLN